MAIHITLDGTRHESKTVGQWPALGKGNHWRNDEPIGQPPVWRETVGAIPSMPVDTGPKLFGYDEAEFMARQYKKGR